MPVPDPGTVASHYARDSLLVAIEAGLSAAGINRGDVGVEELAPVDEFHIGGRVATERLLNHLGVTASDRILDIGCGLGGAARFAAKKFECNVTGIDLTRDYVSAGQTLCEWVALDKRVRLVHGNGAATPFASDTFDAVYMLHVGMNIADKIALFREVHRVLKPRGSFGIYDIMRVGPGELNYPVPWATTAAGSALASPAEYREALKTAGFVLTREQNYRDFALEFFARMQADAAATEAPPPLGLHILMGDEAATKFRNMIESVTENRIAPVEFIGSAAGRAGL